MGSLADREWNADRRTTYLLRDVVRPLSVDPIVWPTAIAPSDLSPTQQPWHIGWVPRPEWIGPNGAWDNLAQMEAALSVAPGPAHGNEVWKIAITWHASDALQAGSYGPYVEPTLPSARDDSWELLGFDVADPGISGLTNCGYTAAVRGDLQSVWASRLNDFHLFKALDDALAFVNVTNQRVSEHAPFFVIGLWRIHFNFSAT